eukprot:s3180_g11.t1
MAPASLHYFQVAADEEVKVVGSCDELGSWDTSNAVPLSRVEQVKGCWWTNVGVRIPLKEEFEYRYAVFRAHSEDFLRWAKEHEEPRFAVATGKAKGVI